MANARPDPHEPTEETPKGFEVPVPKRADVLGNLKKIAKPPVKRTERPEKPK